MRLVVRYQIDEGSTSYNSCLPVEYESSEKFLADLMPMVKFRLDSQEAHNKVVAELRNKYASTRGVNPEYFEKVTPHVEAFMALPNYVVLGDTMFMLDHFIQQSHEYPTYIITPSVMTIDDWFKETAEETVRMKEYYATRNDLRNR